MIPYETPNTFVSDVDQFHSAVDLNLLAQNALEIDRLSYRNVPTFDYTREEPGVVYQASVNTKGDKRFWWGSVQVPYGATSLVLEGRLTRYSSETLGIYINGSGSPTATVTSNGAWTRTITLSSISAAAGDVVEVEVRKTGDTAGWGIYDVDAVYCTPVALADAWPGVPTFAGTYTAAAGNQIAQATDWLLRRIAAVPFVPQLAQVWRPGTYKPHPSVTAEPWTWFNLYGGSILRAQTNDIWRVGLTYENFVNVESYVDLVLNGSIVSTSGPFGPGSVTNLYIPVSLSGLSLGQRAPVAIRERVVQGTTNSEDRRNSRISIAACRTEPSGAGHTYATAPATYTGDASISSATHDSRLNAIATILSTVKSRIDGRPELWNRAYAMRKRYAVDTPEYQKGKMQSWHPHRFDTRRGDRLVVRGKGVTLCWGAVSYEVDGEGNADYTKTKYQYEEGLIASGPTEETKTFYLDSYPNLLMGQAYYLKGEAITYAAEHLL